MPNNVFRYELLTSSKDAFLKLSPKYISLNKLFEALFLHWKLSTTHNSNYNKNQSILISLFVGWESDDLKIMLRNFHDQRGGIYLCLHCVEEKMLSFTSGVGKDVFAATLRWLLPSAQRDWLFIGSSATLATASFAQCLSIFPPFFEKKKGGNVLYNSAALLGKIGHDFFYYNMKDVCL